MYVIVSPQRLLHDSSNGVTSGRIGSRDGERRTHTKKGELDREGERQAGGGEGVD